MGSPPPIRAHNDEKRSPGLGRAVQSALEDEDAEKAYLESARTRPAAINHSPTASSGTGSDAC